jgi:hypothetical protein
VLLLVVVALLCAPGTARANGDPASDYLLLRSIFLPFDAKVDHDVTDRLANTITAAGKAKMPIKVAVIGSRYDLGTAFSLFNKAQRYAEFLGLELSFQYQGPLLVVMPNGYGYSINGKPDPAGMAVVQKLPPPGKDATKQIEGATTAIRRLAAAKGIVLSSGGGGSETRDRIVIAAGAVALAALLAAIVFYRRERTPAAE